MANRNVHPRPKPPNPYRELSEAMNDAGIRYLVIGGVAVNLHGYPRFTGDLDILLALDPENLERTAVVMAQRGFTHRLPIDVRELSDRKQVRKWMTEKRMTAYLRGPALPQLSIDILTGDSLRFDSFDKRKIIIEAWNVAIPVISIDDLIGMKRKTKRRKDADDLAALLELKTL